jgi:hypothetical protein
MLVEQRFVRQERDRDGLPNIVVQAVFIDHVAEHALEQEFPQRKHFTAVSIGADREPARNDQPCHLAQDCRIGWKYLVAGLEAL